MITQQVLNEEQVDELYQWIDSLTLTKPKKIISRDFSDGTMMAETIQLYFPKFVDMHNYPSGSSLKAKLANWKTLNNKVLSKLGITLIQEDCKRLSAGTPSAVEPVLYEFKKIAEEFDQKATSDKKVFFDTEQRLKEPKTLKNQNSSRAKIQELKDVLQLLYEKISLVERSTERKDIQIRELESIIKQHTN